MCGGGVFSNYKYITGGVFSAAIVKVRSEGKT